MTPAGRFDLPLLGFEVKEIAMSAPIAITLHDPASPARAVLTLTGSFRLETPTGHSEILDPHGAQDVTGLLRLRAETVTDAFATLDGTISIHFANGPHIIAGPAIATPSWQLTADRYQLAARLTGGLEVHPTTTTTAT